MARPDEPKLPVLEPLTDEPVEKARQFDEDAVNEMLFVYAPDDLPVGDLKKAMAQVSKIFGGTK